ncbi:MAG: hypothetical protein QOI42_895 [Frankiaceae bacterium]|jgi:DNA-binding response OmpR family regulator|nr:hypothetical protein [Frankiaceae bacterium]
MARQRILVVEDDAVLRAELVDALTAQGYDVQWAATGAAALPLADARPDLVLLDLGLPDIDGVAVARQLRHLLADAVIVVLTARTDELDVVSALDAGADDYLTKPFRLAELLARLRAHLRRQSATDTTPSVTAGALIVDLRLRHASVGDAALTLRPKELELLALLVGRAGEPLRREDIMATVWDEHWFGSTKTLDVHVAALRRKLERAGASAGEITTLRGFGYRYDAAT